MNFRENARRARAVKRRWVKELRGRGESRYVRATGPGAE